MTTAGCSPASSICLFVFSISRLARQDARFLLVCFLPTRRRGKSSSSAISVFKFPIKLRLRCPPRPFNLMKMLAQDKPRLEKRQNFVPSHTKERRLQPDKVLVRLHHANEDFPAKPGNQFPHPQPHGGKFVVSPKTSTHSTSEKPQKTPQQ